VRSSLTLVLINVVAFRLVDDDDRYAAQFDVTTFAQNSGGPTSPQDEQTNAELS